ncbi:nitroreductase family protein [Streptomyces mirabilis]|uniref:hypothetical protein n=1 Tax=Streptomyces mirabilis TaxID=68239 RepID=UPI00368F762B
MFNVQPLRVLFVRSRDGFDRLLPHLHERIRVQSQGAPVTPVLACAAGLHASS